MSAGAAAALSLRTAPERKVPRYKLTVPLDLTVLRSGIPDNISGRTLEIGEVEWALSPRLPCSWASPFALSFFFRK